MRGRWHEGSDKWTHINQIMKEQKIGALALQEKHLTKEDESTLNSTPGLRLHIISSIDPAHTNTKGVAIIVPGRALLMVIPWLKNTTLKILAIYAPNDPRNNQYFWELVHSKIKNLPRPNIMLGDFNLTPPQGRPTQPHIVTLKSHLKLKDGWRQENPDTLLYTFAQSARQGGHQSRIDRIYVNEELLPFNHQLVSARISKKNMPFVGEGRWSLPLYVLNDKRLSEDLVNLGKALNQEITEHKNQHTKVNNP
ncbi:hypothetical protein DEU56DRAFT_872233 [Suillus clintonianus]|uniref:uncharacterized protein n=1 Tax=Suillus clintonianus TaxID=1904413 RepID=UPI001B865D31|nr:uncharacterized protein DEU56DRAFT_872233 [Suillus clintonianus]KAG2131067.1 hypothetical protein DEU56DRAFT_872233 [Suillus clintonianus]